MCPLSREGAELLFQVLAERHEKKSVVITTNLGFGDWTQIFVDPTLTAALLDRVTHKGPCHPLLLGKLSLERYA